MLALTSLIDELFEAVGARFGIFPIRRPLFLFLWKRLSRIKQRFATLAARFAAGKGFPARPPQPRTVRATRRPRDGHAFRITKWVRPNFGWLCRVVPGYFGASAFALELRALLTTDPEMLALLAATPATGRLLRPLCWMLGVALPPPPVVLAATPGAPSSGPSHDDADCSSRLLCPPRSVVEPSPQDPPDDDCVIAFLKAA